MALVFISKETARSPRQEMELAALLQRQMKSKLSVIYPIFIGSVDTDTVCQKWPFLGDLKALRLNSEDDAEEICRKIENEMKPSKLLSDKYGNK